MKQIKTCQFKIQEKALYYLLFVQYLITNIPNNAESSEPIITATLIEFEGQPPSNVIPPINKLKVKPIPPRIAIE